MIVLTSSIMAKPDFTTTLLVRSHESNACSVFALQACIRDHLNAKDADMENMLHSHDVTTKIVFK